MSIRQNAPAAIYTSADTTGTTGSVVWTLTQLDFNNLLVRYYPTFTGGSSPTCDVVIQTSPDGGTTFYDVAHMTQGTTTITVANAFTAVIGNLKGPNAYIGTAARAGTLAAGSVSQMPLFRTMKVVYTYGGTIGSVVNTVDFLPVDVDLK